MNAHTLSSSFSNFCMVTNDIERNQVGTSLPFNALCQGTCMHVVTSRMSVMPGKINIEQNWRTAPVSHEGCSQRAVHQMVITSKEDSRSRQC